MRRYLLKAALALPLFAAVVPLHAQGDKAALYQTVLSLDQQLFDAANRCDYEKLTSMVDENLEFYHDKAGLMVGRKTFLESIKNNTCGKMIRQLVPGSMEVYPVKDYGAIQIATHRFHHPGAREGVPRSARPRHDAFSSIPEHRSGPSARQSSCISGELKDGSSKLTRVVSYDH